MGTVNLGIATEVNIASSINAARGIILGLAVDVNVAFPFSSAKASTSTPASANSFINVNLGNVPQIDDPVKAAQVYEALLTLHNAVEAILEGLNNPP